MYQNPQVESIPFQSNPQEGQLQAVIKYFKTIPNSKYERDIIPGTYEGGMKIWDCEIDLLKYIQQHASKPNHKVVGQGLIDFKGKRVIEIGCGHGLLGIAALKLGALKVCFQDYNRDVINEVTKPTLFMNFPTSHQVIAESCQFVYGDWADMDPNSDFDIVLGSELIYREQNYQKVAEVIKKLMGKSNGKCILANKHYYFGVGGNMPGFKQALDSRGMKWKTLQKIVPEKGGNKKQIIEIWVD